MQTQPEGTAPVPAESAPAVLRRKERTGGKSLRDRRIDPLWHTDNTGRLGDFVGASRREVGLIFLHGSTSYSHRQLLDGAVSRVLAKADCCNVRTKAHP